MLTGVGASLPTFLVVGAMKAGTTSLWRYLRAHPEVFLPDEKEPDFFVEEKTWSRGLDWYRGLFADGTAARARGEASTNYTKHPLFPGVPERIASILPDVRIVYVVRDPLERIVSQYRHALRAGWERRPLERAIVEDPQYVAISSYASQLRRYHEHFAPEQVLVVTAEDLRDKREVTVATVLGFIGVDPALPRDALADEHHASPAELPRRGLAAMVQRIPGRNAVRRLVPAAVRNVYTRATALDHPDRVRLSDATRDRIIDQLRPEVAALQAMVGVPLDGWGLVP